MKGEKYKKNIKMASKQERISYVEIWKQELDQQLKIYSPL